MRTYLSYITTKIENATRWPLGIWALNQQIVLYIEDINSDIKATQDELEPYQIKVVGGYGNEIKRIAQNERIALAIVDNFLPDGRSGFELLGEIKENLGHDIPVVGYSAIFENITQCRAIAKQYEQKVDGYVRKPSTKNELAKAVCFAYWRTVRGSFRNSVYKALKETAPTLASIQTLSKAKGTVVNVAPDVCTVQFKSRKESVNLQFPTWRLMRIGADNLECRVEHVVLKGGTQVVSDLKGIQRKPISSKRLSEEISGLSPKDKQILEKAEKKAKQEEESDGK